MPSGMCFPYAWDDRSALLRDIRVWQLAALHGRDRRRERRDVLRDHAEGAGRVRPRGPHRVGRVRWRPAPGEPQCFVLGFQVCASVRRADVV